MGKRIIRSTKQSRKRQIREMRMLGLKAKKSLKAKKYIQINFAELEEPGNNPVDIPEDFDMFEGNIVVESSIFNIHSHKNLKMYKFCSTWNEFWVSFDPR